jgi:hypothetical protein
LCRFYAVSSKVPLEKRHKMRLGEPESAQTARFRGQNPALGQRGYRSAYSVLGIGRRHSSGDIDGHYKQLRIIHRAVKAGMARGILHLV